VQNNGPRHLIRELSEKNLEIYPETITFKLIDYLPDTILEKSIGKLD